MGRKLPIVDLRPQSHQEVVARYIVEKRQEAKEERRYCAELPTAEAARRAALALTPDDKRHPHQTPFRIRQETLDRWGSKVLAHLDWLLSAETFEVLHDRLESLKIKGVGPPTIYDTAHRLGAKLGLQPSLVYLHCGTLEGRVGEGEYAPQLAIALWPYSGAPCRTLRTSLRGVGNHGLLGGSRG